MKRTMGSLLCGLPINIAVLLTECNTGHFFSKIQTCTFFLRCEKMFAEKVKLQFGGLARERPQRLPCVKGAGCPKGRLRDCRGRMSEFALDLGEFGTAYRTIPPTSLALGHLPLHKGGFGALQICSPNCNLTTNVKG